MKTGNFFTETPFFLFSVEEKQDFFSETTSPLPIADRRGKLEPLHPHQSPPAR